MIKCTSFLTVSRTHYSPGELPGVLFQLQKQQFHINFILKHQSIVKYYVLVLVIELYSIPILPVHHPNKNLSTLFPPSLVPNTLHTTLRNQQEKKKLAKTITQSREIAKRKAVTVPLNISVKEKKATLLTVKPAVYQGFRNQPTAQHC